MQSSAPLDYENIKKDIENINKIKNIHHVHTWMSNENTFYFEAHIELEDMMISDTKIILEQIHNVLKEKYSISHITIQFEVDKCLWQPPGSDPFGQPKGSDPGGQLSKSGKIYGKQVEKSIEKWKSGNKKWKEGGK